MTHAAVKEDWKRVQADLAVAVGDEAFRLFLKNTLVVQLREDLAEIGVPNLTVADYLEERFSRNILDSIQSALGYRPSAIKFSVNGHLFRRMREVERTNTPEQASSEASAETEGSGAAETKGSGVGDARAGHKASGGNGHSRSPGKSSAGTPRETRRQEATGEKEERRQVFRLNERFTLDSFILGAHNKLAFNAAVEIASSPGRNFNPLFIYGGVGLGKTHLMQGIARRLETSKPSLRVLFVSAEYFFNQFTGALRAKTLDSFRERFRSLDVLLIDDIADFVGKPKCQDELLHTLNALTNANKQLVISASVHPKELSGLSTQLRSRFMQGMVAELKEPGYQARLSIIKSKIGPQRKNYPDPVITYLADKLDCNIRELEGYLTQLTAIANYNREPLTVTLVQAALDEFLPGRHRTVQLADVENVVIAHYGVSSAELRGKSRKRTLATARQVCMYLARNLTQYSLKEIGRFYGNKNHTTVVFANNKINKAMDTDVEMRSVVEHLKRLLTNKA